MKTLRVCHSRDLPSIESRDSNFIYFLYDKLEVFLGKNHYSDPYAIVQSYPSDPVAGMLYFCLDDGYVKSKVNLETINIAEIETYEQLEILKQAGSTFFVNADKRYLDARTKTIVLPFHNGTYELTLSLANDLKINENTLIGFNPETQCFEIIGDHHEPLIFTYGYTGEDTDTLITNVEDHKISGDVHLSNNYDNIIKVASDGLYASVNDRVSSEVFEDWTERFKTYKTDMEEYIAELTDLVERAEEIISTDSITRKINEALQAVYPEIDSALANYNNYAREIDEFTTEMDEYARTTIEAARQEIIGEVEEATANPWEEFTS